MVCRRMHVLDLDIWEPQGPVGTALDDPPAQLRAEIEREVGTVIGVDVLGSPAAQLCVQLAGTAQIPGVQLEMDHGLGAHVRLDHGPAENSSLDR